MNQSRNTAETEQADIARLRLARLLAPRPFLARLRLARLLAARSCLTRLRLA